MVSVRVRLSFYRFMLYDQIGDHPFLYALVGHIVIVGFVIPVSFPLPFI